MWSDLVCPRPPANDVRSSVYTLHSGTVTLPSLHTHTQPCMQSHAHRPSPPQTPTSCKTVTSLSSMLSNREKTCTQFRLTSSQPSSPRWLINLSYPLPTSRSLQKPFSSIFLPPEKWPPSLQVLLGRSRNWRVISVSHQCFQLSLKVGPFVALGTVAMDTTGDIILFEGGYLGSAL